MRGPEWHWPDCHADALASAEAAKQACEAFNNYIGRLQAVEMLQEFIDDNNANK